MGVLSSIPGAAAQLASAGIGAVGGMAGSLFSGIMSAVQAKKNREWQSKENQLNRDFEAAEALKSRQFEQEMYETDWQNKLDQWNRENEYNSAASQRSRLEAAGLNPYLMMSGGSAGSAASGVSGTMSSPPSAHAPSGQSAPNMPDYSGIANAFQVGTDLFSRVIQNFVDLKSANDRANAPGIGNALGISQTGLNNANIGLVRANEDLARVTGDKINAETTLLYLKADYQRILNDFADQQQQAELLEKTSHAFALHKQGELSAEQMNTEITKQVLNTAQANGQKISNEIASKTAKGLIDAINAKNAYDEYYYKENRKYVADNAFYSSQTAYYNMKQLQAMIDKIEADTELTKQQKKNLIRQYKIMASQEARAWLDSVGNFASNMMSFKFPKLSSFTGTTHSTSENYNFNIPSLHGK